MAAIDVNSDKISELVPHIGDILANEDQKSSLTVRIESLRDRISSGEITEENDNLKIELKQLYNSIRIITKVDTLPDKKLQQAIISCLNLMNPLSAEFSARHLAYHSKALELAFINNTQSGKTSSEIVRKYVLNLLNHAYKAFDKRAVFLLRQSSSVPSTPEKPTVVLSKVWQSPRSGRMRQENILFSKAEGIWTSSQSKRRWKQFQGILNSHLPQSTLGIREPNVEDIKLYFEDEARQQQHLWDDVEGFPIEIDDTVYTPSTSRTEETADQIMRALKDEDVYAIRRFMKDSFCFEQFFRYSSVEVLEKLQASLNDYPYVKRLFETSVEENILGKREHQRFNQSLIKRSFRNIHDMLAFNTQLYVTGMPRLLQYWGIETKEDFVHAGLLSHLTQESIDALENEGLVQAAETRLSIADIFTVKDLIGKGVFNIRMLADFLAA